MYNVIIVEDDAIVRTYLAGLIEWESYGMKVLGQFTNGMEAKQFIEKNIVDIVITDVSMPVMNGVELIKYIKSTGKTAKVIVLSCHSDYDFIREALKCGVSDYILKQYLTRESLLDLLKKLIRELEVQKESRVDTKEVNHAIKSNLLKNIITGIVCSESEAIEQVPSARCIFENSRYFIAVAKIDDFFTIQEKMEKEQLNKYSSIILKVFESTVKEYASCIVGQTRNNEFTLLLGFQVNEELTRTNEKVDRIMNSISTEIMRAVSLSVSIGVSNACDSFSQLAVEYKRTQSMIEGNILFHKGKIIFLKNQRKCSYFTLTLEDEKDLLRVIAEENINEAIALIESYLDKFQIVFEEVRSLKACIIDLVNILTRIAIKCEVEPQVLFQNDHVPYEEIESKQNIDEIRNWFVEIIKRLIFLNSGKNNSYRAEILKAVEFIEKHYSEDIALRDVATHVNISPNYFSMIFKKEMDVAFSEFLLNIRLEKSKVFLRKKDIKIYEAAFKAGFNNNQYFNRVFKEKYGITPLAYKKENQ